MTLEHSHTSAFIDSVFWDVDLSGTTFRACNLAGVRILGSNVTDIHMTGWDGEVGTVVIDGVDVTDYVASVLNERFPERVLLKAASSADDFRSLWPAIEDLWAQTVERARMLPEDRLNERVNGEWSFIETLRHLAFAVDVWIDRMILGETRPFCALGLPPEDYPKDEIPQLGLDPAARPSLAVVLTLHSDHLDRVRGVLQTVSDEVLLQTRTARPTPAFGEESQTVEECLRVVMREHIEHRRFAVRDLAELEGHTLKVAGPR